MTCPQILIFETRMAASQAAADAFSDHLKAALSERGAASLMLSGGSTPAEMFRLLQAAPLEWAGVTVGLVDDRWVPGDHDMSNERLVRDTFLTGLGDAATFLSMYRGGQTVSSAVDTVADAYAAALPADALLLGMGTDGHTASWFPGAVGTEMAMSPEIEQSVAAIDAAGCPVAGDVTDRMTLTYPAICSARHAALLIFGDDKRAVLDCACQTPSDLPIRAAMDGLGDRLTVYWAP